MESQNEENPVGSSSSTFPIESESQFPMQVDEVTTEVIDETRKRKVISDAWNHFKLVMVNRVRFVVCKYCNTHIKSTKNYGTSAMLDHIRSQCRKKTSNLDTEGSSGGDGSQQHYFDQDVSCRELAHAIILYE
ncbi:hypothetical protein A4A49_56358, partial [Nicotiana attenuata]